MRARAHQAEDDDREPDGPYHEEEHRERDARDSVERLEHRPADGQLGKVVWVEEVDDLQRHRR